VTTRPYTHQKRPRPNLSHGGVRKIGHGDDEDEYFSIKQLRDEICFKNECISKIPIGSLTNGWHLIKGKGENERRGFVLNSLESNAIINMSDNTKKRSLLGMKFEGIEVCKNAWYKAFCITRATFFSHKRKFLNGDIRAVMEIVG